MIITDIESALELENRINEFLKKCVLPFSKKKYSNQAIDKFMASVGGWMPISPKLRWPYQGIPESEIEPVRSKALDIIPEFF